ncbi:hypothetical protein D3C73_1203280 [compost metagenome]
MHITAFANHGHSVHSADSPVRKQLRELLLGKLIRLCGRTAEHRQDNTAIHKIKIQVAKRQPAVFVIHTWRLLDRDNLKLPSFSVYCIL